MKIRSIRTSQRRHPVAGSRRRQEGMAVIVVIALMAILLVYVAGNLRALYCLGAELRLVEKQQKQRLAAATAGGNVRTNSVPKSQVQSQLKRPQTTDHGPRTTDR